MSTEIQNKNSKNMESTQLRHFIENNGRHINTKNLGSQAINKGKGKQQQICLKAIVVDTNPSGLKKLEDNKKLSTSEVD